MRQWYKVSCVDESGNIISGIYSALCLLNAMKWLELDHKMKVKDMKNVTHEHLGSAETEYPRIAAES